MSGMLLLARRVLLAEDEYILAYELGGALEDAGAQVLGPVPSVAQALALLAGEDLVDGAVLDISLGGEMAFPIADALADRGVPFVFTTGYDAAVVPARHSSVVRCVKPVDSGAIVRAIAYEIEQRI